MDIGTPRLSTPEDLRKLRKRGATAGVAVTLLAGTLPLTLLAAVTTGYAAFIYGVGLVGLGLHIGPAIAVNGRGVRAGAKAGLIALVGMIVLMCGRHIGVGAGP